jgi:exonuclease SbcC
MRPLDLTVTGLRSHSGTTTVTFPDDWQLAAVVGPTGAGKSSLLEALVYALFGSGTVPDASQPTNLIADNTREMRIVLNFEVAGTEHKVVRTYRRTGTPPPPVLMSPGHTISGVKPVEDAVTRLLGLTKDAFCQTALLPQGRFARLLEAGPTDQRRTLDEFFRLGEVTDIANRIATASDQLTTGRDRVSTVRRQLPPNPAADLATAVQVLDTARTVALAAAALETEVTRLLTDADDAANRAAEHQRMAVTLDAAAVALASAADKASDLATLATELGHDEAVALQEENHVRNLLAAARQRLDALDAPTVTAARSALRTLSTRITEAESAATDATQLDGEALAAETLQHAGEAELENARSDQERLDNDATTAERAAEIAAAHASSGEALAAAVAATAQTLVDARDAADQAAVDLTSATTAAEAATAAHEIAAQAVATTDEQARQADELSVRTAEAAVKAKERADRITALAAALNSASVADAAAATALVDSSAAATLALAASDTASTTRQNAGAVYDKAEAALAGARRAAAAAYAAADVHPGDPCPICARDLPDGFTPPQAPVALTAAETAVRTARKALDAAAAEATRAETHAEAAKRERLAAAETATAVAKRLADDVAAYATAGGESGRIAIEKATETADRDAHWAKDAANTAHQEAARASATLTARAEALGPLRDGLVRAERAHTTAHQAVTAAATAAEEAAVAYGTYGGSEALAEALSARTAATTAAISARSAASAAKEHAEKLNKRLGDLRVTAGNARTAATSAAVHAEDASAAARSAAMDVPSAAREGASVEPREILSVAEAWTTDREIKLSAERLTVGETQTQVEQIAEKLSIARARRIAEHDGPLAELTTIAAGIAPAVDASLPPTGNADALGTWGVAWATTATERATKERGAADAAAAATAKAREAAVDKCAAAGTAIDELSSWKANADAAVGRSEISRTQAETTAARCAQLNQAIASTAGRNRLLEAGKKLSRGRGNFVQHVLAARRGQLLVEAAAILAELSGQRLVFDTDATDRFSVVDTNTATVRDPRLLSGGEQFQASLALSLGLVEIASRGGSRIECLFLDEGFAALDSRSLDIALDALESAASRGRRIVAVTHVDTVTSRCDHVLEVRPGIGGSKASWRELALH